MGKIIKYLSNNMHFKPIQQDKVHVFICIILFLSPFINFKSAVKLSPIPIKKAIPQRKWLL